MGYVPLCFFLGLGHLKSGLPEHVESMGDRLRRYWLRVGAVSWRTCLLILLLACLQMTFVLEQPANSVMLLHKRLAWTFKTLRLKAKMKVSYLKPLYLSHLFLLFLQSKELAIFRLGSHTKGKTGKKEPPPPPPHPGGVPFCSFLAVCNFGEMANQPENYNKNPYFGKPHSPGFNFPWTSPAKIYRVLFLMKDFGSPTGKPTMLLTNSPAVCGFHKPKPVKKVLKKSKRNSPAKPVGLCRRYVDRQGRPRFSGTSRLKRSQYFGHNLWGCFQSGAFL